MDLETLKPNSNKYKREKESKNLAKVVTGDVKVKKKSKGRRILDLFIEEDGVNVREYLIFELLIPAIKDTLVDIIQRSSEMLFYGRVRGSNKRNGNGGTTYVSYSSYSNKPKPTGTRARSVYSFDDIVVESRGEAERVLEILCDMIDQYGEATVADFYELVGVTGNGYTDRSYGWKDLKQAYISRVREGFLFNLPRCIELD